MITECAILTECDVQADTLTVYKAKSCNGDKNFSYHGSWATLGEGFENQCPVGYMMEIEYNHGACNNNNCEADYIQVATGSQCAEVNCII